METKKITSSRVTVDLDDRLIEMINELNKDRMVGASGIMRMALIAYYRSQVEYEQLKSAMREVLREENVVKTQKRSPSPSTSFTTESSQSRVGRELEQRLGESVEPSSKSRIDYEDNEI
jgi:hypothetical protein